MFFVVLDQEKIYGRLTREELCYCLYEVRIDKEVCEDGSGHVRVVRYESEIVYVWE